MVVLHCWGPLKPESAQTHSHQVTKTKSTKTSGLKRTQAHRHTPRVTATKSQHSEAHQELRLSPKKLTVLVSHIYRKLVPAAKSTQTCGLYLSHTQPQSTKKPISATAEAETQLDSEKKKSKSLPERHHVALPGLLTALEGSRVRYPLRGDFPRP